MIHEVSGDILLSRAKAIAHGVAPNDDFHSGLPLALRERMPALYKDFRHYCQTSHPKSGTLWTWMCADGRYIVNLFTREGSYAHGGKPGHASLSNVNHALHALHAWVEKEKIPTLALPRLACGVGGLDWNEVKPLIEKHLGSLNTQVYIYVNYNKGERANEA